MRTTLQCQWVCLVMSSSTFLKCHWRDTLDDLFGQTFQPIMKKNSNNVKISVGITLFLNSFTDDILMTLNQNEIKMLLKNCFPLSWYITLKTLFFAFLGYMDRLIVTHNHCSCYCSVFVKVRALDSTHICFLYEAEFHLVFVGLSKALFFLGYLIVLHFVS